MEVSLYVADAPAQKLDLLGENQHDWAYILGPNGYDAMDKAASLSHTIEHAASIAAVAAALMCLVAPLRGAAPPSVGAGGADQRSHGDLEALSRLGHVR